MGETGLEWELKKRDKSNQILTYGKEGCAAKRGWIEKKDVGLNSGIWEKGVCDLWEKWGWREIKNLHLCPADNPKQATLLERRIRCGGDQRGGGGAVGRRCLKSKNKKKILTWEKWGRHIWENRGVGDFWGFFSFLGALNPGMWQKGNPTYRGERGPFS